MRALRVVYLRRGGLRFVGSQIKKRKNKGYNGVLFPIVLFLSVPDGNLYMGVKPTQTTLSQFGFFNVDPPLETTPLTYLHANNPPETHPTLLFDPPIKTPVKPPTPTFEPLGEQATLSRWINDMCPVCQSIEVNVPEHLLLQHADVVNDRMVEIRNERDSKSTPEPDDSIEPDVEPVLFKEAPAEKCVGQSLDGFNDPRECNDCGTCMSKGYSMVFATESGDLYCPDCRSRSERYSNKGGTFNGTDPASVRGSRNPNSSANNSSPGWTEL